jgi:CubicO group peptidase (beta-lactamase class C family)
MKILQTIVFAILSLTLMSGATIAQQVKVAKPNYQLAAEYSRQLRGLSVVVVKGDKIVFEDYQNGYTAEDSQMLASGTKSFNGVMLAAAIEDKLVSSFDEKVADTITEWRRDAQKSQITLRHLLSLTSGIDTGENGRPPAYSEAIKFSMKYEPGTAFEYGPAPFQIFGEVMRRKLETKKETPLDYLKRRILNPINLNVADWRLQNGQPNLPSGAYLSAGEWTKFGIFIKNGGRWNGKQIVSEKLLKELFAGTKTNPNYGLTWWLNRNHNGSANVPEKRNGRNQDLQDRIGITPETTEISEDGFGADFPRDLAVAAGAGKQRLYVIPSLDLVIVRQGRQSRFDDAEFLARLFYGKTSAELKNTKKN